MSQGVLALAQGRPGVEESKGARRHVVALTQGRAHLGSAVVVDDVGAGHPAGVAQRRLDAIAPLVLLGALGRGPGHQGQGAPLGVGQGGSQIPSVAGAHQCRG